jgi:hypothetical protein
MTNIDVKKLDETTFEVKVQMSTPTTHIVTVTREYATKLTDDQIAVEKLVAVSFEFLLEREPNTSILRKFDLPVIAHYFPEYERMIAKMLK